MFRTFPNIENTKIVLWVQKTCIFKKICFVFVKDIGLIVKAFLTIFARIFLAHTRDKKIVCTEFFSKMNFWKNLPNTPCILSQTIKT